jgi:hypothetical protein
MQQIYMIASHFENVINNIDRTTYNNNTRNGDNIEIIMEKDKQKKRMTDYLNINHFAKNAGMKDTIKLATGSPNIFYSGPNGDLNTVDDESKLFLGSLQTKSKQKLNLQKRKFVTVPYLADKKSAGDWIRERDLLKEGIKIKVPKFKFRSFLKKRKFVANPYKGRSKNVSLELNLQRGELD